MSCAAIVAVKGAAGAKSRLAGALPPAVRARLVATMLEWVIDAARHADGIAGLVLVSDARQRHRPDVVAVRDEARSLNAAFAAGARVAASRGYRSAILLPADLPFLAPSDLEALVKAGHGAGTAIAPDHTGEGTNALYLPLELPIALAYGPRSCTSHREAYARAGYAPALVQRRGLALDIDEPCDLGVLRDCPAYDFLPLPARSVA